jgi:hypothetical protein
LADDWTWLAVVGFIGLPVLFIVIPIVLLIFKLIWDYFDWWGPEDNTKL